MSVPLARREFLAGIVAMTAAGATPRFMAQTASDSPVFKVAVINDEISQDFGHACEVASRDFGMQWIELRGMWKKNIVNLDEKRSSGSPPDSRKVPAQGHRCGQSSV